MGEPDSGVMKVKDWQRTMYSVDSGIQSAATTVREDDGDFVTSKFYSMTTVEHPGEAASRSPFSTSAFH